MSQAPVPGPPTPRPPTPEADGQRPATGLPGVDDALASVEDLDGRPVGEHHETLAAAHEALHEALESRTDAGS